MKNDIEKYTELSEVLKALAHPVRLCIVKGLLNKGECNVSHMQTCLKTPQSTVSQHLQKLKSAGIIEGRREGLTVYYRVCGGKIEKIIRAVTSDDDN